MTDNTVSGGVVASGVLSSQVNYLPNILNPADHSAVSIREALQLMQDPGLKPKYEAASAAHLFGGDDDYKTAKQQLPAICFQGTVTPGTAVSAANLKAPNGIMVLDCDHRPDADAVLGRVCQSTHVAFAFKSPSGEGVKIGIHVEFPSGDVSAAAYSAYYKQVQEQASVWWPWLESDNSSCNINRLCFASPHPAYVNEEAVTVELTPYVAPAPRRVNPSGTYSEDQVNALLAQIDPGVREDTWFRIGMACQYEDDNLLYVFNHWSSGGLSSEGCPGNYSGFDDIESRWTSWGRKSQTMADPITMASVERLARLEDQKTIDWSAVVPDDQERSTCPYFKQAVDSINRALEEVCGGVNDPASPIFYEGNFSKAWEGCFAVSASASLFLNRSGLLVKGKDTTLVNQLQSVYGAFINTKRLDESFHSEISDKERQAGVKKVAGVVRESLKSGIFAERQRDSSKIRVDMFAEDPVINLESQYADVVLPHRPFRFDTDVTIVPGTSDDVLSDYKEHFPDFDRVMDLAVACKFASSRRQAYLWLMCYSDWGKNFLMEGLLGDDGLNVITNISVKAVEKVFEGSPIPLSYEDFIYNMGIWVDEFKTIRSELKQLDNHITGAPKNRMNFTAPLGMKVFTSAEDVDALSGVGVEEQFGNRFNIIEYPTGVKLMNRPLFSKLSGKVYHAHLCVYLADRFNKFVEDMQAKGTIEAARHCDGILNTFHGDYGINNVRGTLSEAVGQLVIDLRAELMKAMGKNPEIGGHILLSNDSPFHNKLEIVGTHLGLALRIKSPAVCIKAWIRLEVGEEEARKVSYKAADICTGLNDITSYKTATRFTDNGGEQIGKGVFMLFKSIFV